MDVLVLKLGKFAWRHNDSLESIIKYVISIFVEINASSMKESSIKHKFIKYVIKR